MNPPMTANQFEEGLRRSLIVDKLRSALTDWMAVADSELEREYAQRNEKVKLQVVALTADRFRDKVTVTDADVAAHYQSHSAEYRRPDPFRSQRVLVVGAGNSAGEIAAELADAGALVTIVN